MNKRNKKLKKLRSTNKKVKILNKMTITKENLMSPKINKNKIKKLVPVPFKKQKMNNSSSNQKNNQMLK